ncbi:MAG: PAS domain S-box protein, partial [Dongiaceae bacterium]
MVVRFSSEHRIAYANPAYCRYRGLTLAELVGTWVYADIADIDRDEVQRHYSALSRDHPVSTIEHRAIGVDGELRWQQWTNRTLFDDTGRFIAYQSTGRDITDRRQAEDALRASEARFRAIVEDLTELVTRHRPDGTLTYAGPSYCRYYGTTAEALLGRSWHDHMLEEDRERVAAYVLALTRENPIGTIEHRVVLPDGRVRWQQWTDRALFGAGDQPIEIQSVGRDITERKLAEDALQNHQALLRAVIDSVPGMVMVKDRAGRYVLVNDFKARHDGRPVDWYLGKTMAELYPKQFVHEREEAETRVFATGAGTGFFEYEFEDDTGEISHWLGHIAPIKNSTGAVQELASIAIDITARKRMEAALRDSQTLLRAIIDTIPALVAVKDLEGRYVLVNRHHCTYDGRPPEWYAGKKPADLYTDGYVEPADAREREVIATGLGAGLFEYEYVDPHGTGSYWLGDISPVLDVSGAAKLLVSVAIDITERRRAEAAFRESEERFRGAFESSPHGMALVAPDGKWIKINRALCDITGFSQEELLRTDFLSITHPEDLDLDLAQVQRVLAGEISS